jgi:sulfite reductase alpha subunit-like flavoprotein/cytochrome b involved in lipid metabolism
MAEIKEMQNTKGVKSLDKLNVDDRDLLAVALGAPARQVLLRAEEIGPQTGWRDGYLSTEYGFCPPDTTEAPGALRNSPGRVWTDLCERMPGCVARGRVRESIGALPIVEGTADIIPDKALWAALVCLGMLCSIWRYEEKHDGNEGINVSTKSLKLEGVPMCEDLGDEVFGIPLSIGLPYVQISIRMGRSIPHLTFFDQSSYNVDIKDPLSSYPYVGRFDNTTLRWAMFGDSAENAFLKGCADTAASFQHGVDAIAECQEHVMNRNNEGLLRSLVRLKEVLERMPNAFHTISPNDRSGENYVSPPEWVRWAKFSAPLSKRCPATSGLQFPPYLVMDAFLGRVKYDSFLGNEGVHLRAWLPSNLRAFIAAIEYHYQIPAYVKASNDPRLIGVLDGVVEAYTGERGFMGVHRYKVFGLLECAAKTGRVETNGNSGGTVDRSWEGVHKEFSESMKERLEPFRGNFDTQPHEMRGTFEECRYRCRILSRNFVDADPNRSIAQVTLDIENSGITFAPGDRLAVMPMNSWTECAKVAAALGLDSMLEHPVTLDKTWSRFADHMGSITRTGRPELTVIDILRKGHLAPLTKTLVMKLHNMLRASSNTVLKVLATDEWPVRGSLGDLLQSAVNDTSSRVWDQAFDLSGNFSWLIDLIPVEVPRTYSISTYSDELLPSTVDLTISRSDYQLCSTFAGNSKIIRHGVSSGFLNPPVNEEIDVLDDEELLIGVSRPSAFQLPFDETSPVALFAGGSGIAPFRSFWQSRAGRSFGKTILYLGVQSRERFAYEDELRRYVNEGLMEVHTAFSRDSRGLVYDQYSRDLVEKEMPPRYIDGLIVEQGQAICDFVMSKKQGGIGGYIYVCGSVGVFDSVMSGIRKAIYNHRSNSMESADAVLNLAFAERRFMIDVFMTPKPLPCNQPTLPLSQLAMHTGHRPESRLWIGVHGKVYDVTDFGAMHPGGMNIIKSNAGVDCSRSFDLLAHTNNPEVSSLLTKYYIGEMTPKPMFQSEDLSMLYDLWAQYLRVAVETVVASHFEVGMIMESSNVWFQGDLLNMGGVRRFYHYQSRLLQGGFSSLFGAKLQELYLKISFKLANASSSTGPTLLPDVLGIIARAKGSTDALTASNEISQIGQFTSNSDAARHHEKGIIAYAQKSVEFDMEFLEQIREEACAGMDAFDTIMELEAQSETQRVAALSTFLMQVLDRMANRLEGFYGKLARYSVFRPEMERNPARARWEVLKRKVRDGSFFVLTQKVSMATTTAAATNYDQRNIHQHQGVDFDMVVSQIQMNLDNSPLSAPRKMDLTEQHAARAEVKPNGVPAYEHHHNGAAIKAMSTFMDKNRKAIRRLSKLPQAINLEQLMQTYSSQPHGNGLPTPPSSRSSSRSPSTSNMNRNQLSRRNTASEAPNPGRMLSRRNTGTSDSSLSPTPVHVSPATAMSAMIAKLNTRPKTGANSLPLPPQSAGMVERTRSMQTFSSPRTSNPTHSPSLSHGAGNIDTAGGRSRSRSNTGSLRSFRLQASAMAGGMNMRGNAPQE